MSRPGTRPRRTDGGRASATSRDTGPSAGDDELSGEETRASIPESKSPSGRRPPKPLASGLYLVATPIGNAADISLRALDVLAQADVIACEDTRVTARLLALHGISRPLSRYDEHTARNAGPALLERVARGERVALVSDAGTPLVSDPGDRLVRGCVDAGLPVLAIPGASSVMAALCISGLPTRRFMFLGFLSPRSVARRQELSAVAELDATLVVLDSAQRLAASLADMAAMLGPRQAAVARELTKLFEEVRRGSLDELATHYRQAGAPKGEVTVVIGPPPPPPPLEDAEAERLLVDALGRMSARDAAASVAERTGLPRRGLYARAIALGRNACDGEVSFPDDPPGTE